MCAGPFLFDRFFGGNKSAGLLVNQLSDLNKQLHSRDLRILPGLLRFRHSYSAGKVHEKT